MSHSSCPRIEALESRFVLSAQPVGPEFQINAMLPSGFSNVSTAADVQGNFVVVWTVAEQIGTVMYDSMTKAGLYSAAGVPRGNDFFVSRFPATQINPDVAMDADGDFVVVWQHYQPGDENVFARGFRSDGTPLGEQFFGQTEPSVAMDSDGDFVVVWTSEDDRAGAYSLTDVYAQRYNAAGEPRGGEFRVNQHWAYRQENAHVAMRPDGSFLVTWEDWYLQTSTAR